MEPPTLDLDQYQTTEEMDAAVRRANILWYIRQSHADIARLFDLPPAESKPVERSDAPVD